ncbi:hypothetical protein [uncultured Modestobacter sp.]|uniref:hypothetical protein n=1 Tax=uncultured Modestobacter sp. TaxID=380048 RepID=UPI0026071E27|nr:hypothetical protein [uncultured Modestobacter sp.]
MRAVELEGRVVAAIEARRNANVSPEDDFVECKGRWPEKDKARQLAGLANRAAGEPVVLIVGFDDRSGAVVDPGPTDPADWWQGMIGQFDQTPPDMLRHMLVHIGPTEKVHAFAFGTDRVPYVVKNGQGRDVPMRDGTSTRSAYRHELLRLLLPTISTPPASMLRAHINVQWRAAREASTEYGRTQSAEPERAYFSGDFSVFVEFPRTGFATLPTHGMRARVMADDSEFPLEVQVRGAGNDERPASAYGVEMRHDCAVITGSGSFHAWLSGDLPLALMPQIEAAQGARLELEFDVVGAERPMRCASDLPAVVTSRRGPLANNPHWRTINEFGIDQS